MCGSTSIGRGISPKVPLYTKNCHHLALNLEIPCSSTNPCGKSDGLSHSASSLESNLYRSGMMVPKSEFEKQEPLYRDQTSAQAWSNEDLWYPLWAPCDHGWQWRWALQLLLEGACAARIRCEVMTLNSAHECLCEPWCVVYDYVMTLFLVPRHSHTIWQLLFLPGIPVFRHKIYLLILEFLTWQLLFLMPV